MKRSILLFLVIFSSSVYAQEYRWGVGLKYFFDNTEYGQLSFIDSETMNGIWLNPMGSLVWGDKYSINVGVNLLKIPGMGKTIDKVDVMMYYQYKSSGFLFRAGSFPRSEVLENYNNFFFKDSVNNFIPLMQGLFCQIGSNRNFFNMWLDWTGYATPKKHEHFFVGLSGKISKGLFFADFQSYMFHYSNTRPATPGEGVCENLQLQATAGLEYGEEGGFKGLIAAGTLIGYERDRRFENKLYKPAGFVARGDAEKWGIGTKNTLYTGEPRMRLADTFGGNLYWGTQFLRVRTYVKSEWYVRLVESDFVKVLLSYNLHFVEGKVLSQQMLTVSASIDSFRPKSGKIINYPWMEIFH